jgi:hypothetical protein
MSANPPIGIPNDAAKQTYSIINNFSQVSGVKTFEYLDSAGGTLALPISDYYTVKGMKINLAVPVKTSSSTANSTMTIQVAIRNKKTNL